MKHKMRPDLAKGQKRPCIFADALCFIDYAEFFFFCFSELYLRCYVFPILCVLFSKNLRSVAIFETGRGS